MVPFLLLVSVLGVLGDAGSEQWQGQTPISRNLEGSQVQMSEAQIEAQKYQGLWQTEAEQYQRQEYWKPHQQYLAQQYQQQERQEQLQQQEQQYEQQNHQQQEQLKEQQQQQQQQEQQQGVEIKQYTQPQSQLQPQPQQQQTAQLKQYTQPQQYAQPKQCAQQLPQCSAPPSYQYPHKSAASTTPEPAPPTYDASLFVADPWNNVVDEPFADGALEELIAEMDRKSRPMREQEAPPTLNEFARSHYKSKSTRSYRQVQEEEEEQVMPEECSPFATIMDYNCPASESESSEYSPVYHAPPPPPIQKRNSRKSRRTNSSKPTGSQSISRLLDTLNNQPTRVNPFVRASRKSRKSHTKSRPQTPAKSARPASINSVVSFSPSSSKVKQAKKPLTRKQKKKKPVKKTANGGRRE